MRFITLFIVFLSLPLIALAEEAPSQIVVTGFGKASAPPDKATITLRIERTQRETGAAMAEVADATTLLLNQIRSYGVTDEDIESTKVSLGEEWDLDSSPRKFLGYAASTSLSVVVRDMERLGPLIATVTRDQPVSLRGPYFEIEDRLALRDEARRYAVKDALSTARLLAEAAEVNLGAPILITDGTLTDLDREMLALQMLEEPMMEEPMLSEEILDDQGIPIIPGAIETTERVKLIFRIIE